jgi:hypothetical protein
MASLQCSLSSSKLADSIPLDVSNMPTFDNTYTDAEFKQEILRADNEWMSQHARPEPDLNVDGLKPSLVSRVLGLFGRSGR